MGSKQRTKEEITMKKFDEKILENVETCIVNGKDSDACLDDVMRENKIDNNERDALKKAVLEYSKQK